MNSQYCNFVAKWKKGDEKHICWSDVDLDHVGAKNLVLALWKWNGPEEKVPFGSVIIHFPHVRCLHNNAVDSTVILGMFGTSFAPASEEEEGPGIVRHLFFGPFEDNQVWEYGIFDRKCVS